MRSAPLCGRVSITGGTVGNVMSLCHICLLITDKTTERKGLCACRRTCCVGDLSSASFINSFAMLFEVGPIPGQTVYCEPKQCGLQMLDCAAPETGTQGQGLTSVIVHWYTSKIGTIYFDP